MIENKKNSFKNSYLNMAASLNHLVPNKQQKKK